MYQWPSATCHKKNSEEYLSMLRLECLRGMFGRNGMNGLGCQYRLYLGAGFQMVR